MGSLSFISTENIIYHQAVCTLRVTTAGALSQAVSELICGSVLQDGLFHPPFPLCAPFPTLSCMLLPPPLLCWPVLVPFRTDSADKLSKLNCTGKKKKNSFMPRQTSQLSKASRVSKRKAGNCNTGKREMDGCGRWTTLFSSHHLYCLYV